MEMSRRCVYKVLLFVSLIILYFLVYYFILTVQPAGSYELSIYDAYPPIFWISFASLVVVYGLSLISNATKTPKPLFIYGALSIYTLLLSLPGIRGYFIPERYDVLIHIGMTKDILFHGKIGVDNFYPAMHILIVQIKYVADVSIFSAITYLPVIIYLLFVPYVYIVAKQLVPNSKQKQIVLLVAFLAILHIPTPYLVPSAVSYVLAILTLGVWLSPMKHMKKILVTLLLYTSLIFFHPLTSMYLTLILLIVDSVSLMCHKSDTIKWYPKFYKLAPVVLIIWFAWYLSFYSIQINFGLVIRSIIGEGPKNIFTEKYLTTINIYSLSLLEILQIIVFKYGEQLLSILLGSIYSLVFFYGLLKRSKNEICIQYNLFLISTLFIIFSIWSVLNFFVYFVHPDRVFKYLSLYGILIFPLFISWHIKENFKLPIKVFLALLLSFMTILSLFSMYPSPLWKVENRQVSQSEFIGWGFLFENRDENIKIKDDTKTTQFRFYCAWYGRDSALSSKNVAFYEYIPDHFGYDIVPLVGCQYDKPTYYVISKIIKLLYPRVLPQKEEKWRWRPNEFIRLESDITVSAIYRTEDISVYFVLPKNCVLKSK